MTWGVNDLGVGVAQPDAGSQAQGPGPALPEAGDHPRRRRRGNPIVAKAWGPLRGQGLGLRTAWWLHTIRSHCSP